MLTATAVWTTPSQWQSGSKAAHVVQTNVVAMAPTASDDVAGAAGAGASPGGPPFTPEATDTAALTLGSSSKKHMCVLTSTPCVSIAGKTCTQMANRMRWSWVYRNSPNACTLRWPRQKKRPVPSLRCKRSTDCGDPMYRDATYKCSPWYTNFDCPQVRHEVVETVTVPRCSN